MGITAHKKDLWTTGITVLPNVLSSAEVSHLQSKLEEPFNAQISYLRLKPKNNQKLQCLFDADMERYFAAAKLAQHTQRSVGMDAPAKANLQQHVGFYWPQTCLAAHRAACSTCIIGI